MGFPQMRGNSVLVRIMQRKTQKIGEIEIAGHLDREIEEVEILGSGPGVVSAAGAVPETRDLHAGDHAIAHMRSIRKAAPHAPETIQEKRIPFVYASETLSIIDQSQIIAILPNPLLQ